MESWMFILFYGLLHSPFFSYFSFCSSFGRWGCLQVDGVSCHVPHFFLSPPIRSYLVTVEITWAYPPSHTGGKVQEGRLLLGAVGLRSQVSWMPVLLSAKGPVASLHFTAFVYQEIHVIPGIPPISFFLSFFFFFLQTHQRNLLGNLSNGDLQSWIWTKTMPHGCFALAMPLFCRHRAGR